MTVASIELNDSGIRVGKNGEIQAVSPGIAVIRGNDLLLGDDAMPLARLHPVDTNNIFWHRLSVEPLNKNYARLRHHADLAYHQLMALHQQVGELSDVVFAIPGSFTRDQLSLLLGIVQECPFTAVGLIDSAVAASALIANQLPHDSQSIVHLDLQLHQCLLTSITVGDRVQRQAVNMVADCGQFALYNKLAQFISDQFVGQSRFDPLHSANTEQQLYNQIPAWLEQCREHDELILVVGTKTIKVASEQMITALNPIYERILQQIKQFLPKSNRLLVSDRFGMFPGFIKFFKNKSNMLLLPYGATIESIDQYRDHIISPNGEIGFIQSLPILGTTPPNAGTKAAPTEPSAARTTTPNTVTNEKPTAATSIGKPTHALFQHHAYRLNAAAVFVRGQHTLSFAAHAGEHTRCTLQSDGDKISLTPLASGIRVNHFPVSDNVLLKAGDAIHFDGVAEPIIMVAEMTT